MTLSALKQVLDKMMQTFQSRKLDYDEQINQLQLQVEEVDPSIESLQESIGMYQ
jgi:peptidoglycan hydrolase CwlO-like protein